MQALLHNVRCDCYTVGRPRKASTETNPAIMLPSPCHPSCQPKRPVVQPIHLTTTDEMRSSLLQKQVQRNMVPYYIFKRPILVHESSYWRHSDLLACYTPGILYSRAQASKLHRHACASGHAPCTNAEAFIKRELLCCTLHACMPALYCTLHACMDASAGRRCQHQQPTGAPLHCLQQTSTTKGHSTCTKATTCMQDIQRGLAMTLQETRVMVHYRDSTG
jgi:hypothetical protein